MSLLKDKRIRKLLADVDLSDGEGSSADSDTAGGGAPKTKAQLKKQQKRAAKKAAVEAATPSPAPPAPAPQKAAKKDKDKKDAKQQRKKRDEGRSLNDVASEDEAPAAAKQKPPKAKAASRKDRDEERLLRDLLRQRGEAVSSSEDESAAGPPAAAAGVPDARAQAASVALPSPPASSDPAALRRLLCVADAKQLDYRNERIRTFGKDSVPDVSGEELRRMGFVAPKIRRGVFVTPNSGDATWHALAGADAVDLVLEDPKARPPLRYAVDAKAKAFTKAQAAFEFAVGTSMGDVNALVECWREHPTHLPIILQLSNAFHITGNAANSMLFMDIALHVAGLTLASGAASGAGFVIAKTFAERSLPFEHHANRPVFVTLVRGVHNALNQGCAKTALEIAKVLLSLDQDDPEGGALLIDMTAVRSREWLFVIDAQQRLVRLCLAGTAESGGSATGEGEDGGEGEGGEDENAFKPPSADAVARARAAAVSTLEELVGLPSMHFNAALARRMYADATSEQAGGGGGSKSKPRGNRSAPEPGQLALVAETIPPEAPAVDGWVTGAVQPVRALANAVALFPLAALALAEAIEEKLQASPWSDLVFLVEDVKQAVFVGPSGPFIEETWANLARLFAASSKSMWKATKYAEMLRQAVRLVVDERLIPALYRSAPAPGDSSPYLTALGALRARIRTESASRLHARYANLPEENVTGVFASQIPRELLEAAQEDDGMHFERVPREQYELMQRYEAAFGPAPDGFGFAERMAFYTTLLQDHIAAIGEDENAISLFLRTLLPWNDVNEMALARAFEAAGREDPAVVARREARQREWDVMNRADNLPPGADLPEDEVD